MHLRNFKLILKGSGGLYEVRRGCKWILLAPLQNGFEELGVVLDEDGIASLVFQATAACSARIGEQIATTNMTLQEQLQLYTRISYLVTLHIFPMVAKRVYVFEICQECQTCCKQTSLASGGLVSTRINKAIIYRRLVYVFLTNFISRSKL